MHKIFRAVFRRQIQDLILEDVVEREKRYLDEKLAHLREDISFLEEVSFRERREAEGQSAPNPIKDQDDQLVSLKEDIRRLMKQYENLVSPKIAWEDSETRRRRRKEKANNFRSLFEELIRLSYRVSELSPLYGRTLSFIEGHVAFPRRKASALKEAFERRTGGKASISEEGVLEDAVCAFEEKWRRGGDVDAISEEADQLVHWAKRLYPPESISS